MRRRGEGQQQKVVRRGEMLKLEVGLKEGLLDLGQLDLQQQRELRECIPHFQVVLGNS